MKDDDTIPFEKGNPDFVGYPGEEELEEHDPDWEELMGDAATDEWFSHIDNDTSWQEEQEALLDLSDVIAETMEDM